MPDVLEDGSPGCNADSRPYQHRDLILKDVLRGRTVRPIDFDLRHLLPVLKRHFIHDVLITRVEQLSLGGASADSVSKRAGEVPDLAHVDGDVVVVGAGSDGERVPLLTGDGGHIDEEPLAGFIFHGRLAELDLHGVWTIVSQTCADEDFKSELTIRMAEDTSNLRISATTDLSVQSLHEIQTAAEQLPSPTLVADAVVPEGFSRKWGVWLYALAHEASGGVGVETQ